jgi:hypothetical protein
MKFLKAIGLGVATLAVALVAASPAAALTKQTTIIDLDDAYVIAAGDLCSFPVAVEQGPGEIKVDMFFDANGNPVKAIVTNFGGAFHETVSANGVTLSTVQTFSDFIYFDPSGSIRNVADAGINLIFTLPHQGVVSMQVGLIRFDSNFNPIFVAGPGFRTPPDTDALCAALS